MEVKALKRPLHSPPSPPPASVKPRDCVRGFVFITSPSEILLKFPINLHVEKVVESFDYFRYLWFKGMDRHGVIPKSILNGPHRHTNAYWMRKLVSRGWATKTESGYLLKSYQYVWWTLKTEKVQKHQSQRYAYKFEKLPNFIKTYSPREFFNYCKKYIQQSLADRKKRQIIYRLLTGKYKTNLKNRGQVKDNLFMIKTFEKPVFGTMAAAKTMGYRSRSSGSGVLKRCFQRDLLHIPERYTYLDLGCVKVGRMTPWRIHLYD